MSTAHLANTVLRRSGAALTALLLAAAMANAAAGVANAESWTDSKSIEGGSATCSVSTTQREERNDTANIKCTIKDTKSDKDSVYVVWWPDGYEKERFNNNEGSGTSIEVEDSTKSGDGRFTRVRWQLCRDRLGRDECSAVVSHRTAEVAAGDTVSGPSPTGETYEGGVLDCSSYVGATFGTCSFYFDRQATRELDGELKANDGTINAGTAAACGAASGSLPKRTSKTSYPAAVCAALTIFGGSVKDKAGQAVNAGQCLRIRWVSDPGPIPRGADVEGGRNCLN